MRAVINAIRRHPLRAVFAVLAGAALAAGYETLYLPARDLQGQVNRLEALVQHIKRDHQPAAVVAAVPAASRISAAMEQDMRRIAWLGDLPGFSAPIRNGRRLVAALGDLACAARIGAQAVAPAVSSSSNGGGARAWLEVLAHWQPLDRRLLGELRAAETKLSAVHPSALTPLVGSGRLAAQLAKMQAQITEAVSVLTWADAHAGVVNAVLGIGRPERWLILFQNSGELRATGGFLTAYADLTVSNGRLTWGKVGNIYGLGRTVTYHPPIPKRFHTYFPFLTTLHLRDANLSPSVPESAARVLRFYRSIPHAPKVDTVVWVNTWFADALLAALGPVAVQTRSGPVTFTAANANVKMETLAEQSGRSQATRKAFLGPLMKTLAARALHARGKQLALVLDTVFKALGQKNLIITFTDPALERWAEAAHVGGSMARSVPGDYLAVVNENLDGHKDNYFLRQSVQTAVRRLPSGRWCQTLEVRFELPRVADGWLVVPYTGWIRVYVPKGSRLLALSGPGTVQHTSSVDAQLDKTVFAANIRIPARPAPGAPVPVETLRVRYLLPAGIDPFRLLVQKQAGVRAQALTVTLNAQTVHRVERGDLFISANPHRITATPWGRPRLLPGLPIPSRS